MKSGLKWGVLIVVIALAEWAAMEFLARHYSKRLLHELTDYVRAGKLHDINARIRESNRKTDI